MLPPERLKAEAAYQEQLAPFLKRYAAEKAAKERWIDYHVWDVPSITNAQTEAKSELARLQKLDHAALATRADALQQAAQLAAAGNYEKASLLIKDMGKIPSGSRAATLKQTILDGSRAAAKKDAEEKASAERKKRMAAREAAAAENAAALAAGKQKPPTKPEKTTTEPVAKPTPKPKPEKVANNSDADPEDSLTMDDDGVAFDRTAGESAKSGSGFKFTTLLMVLIPIMAIATFLTLKMAKNNEVEDFVPEETEDESDTTPSL